MGNNWGTGMRWKKLENVAVQYPTFGLLALECIRYSNRLADLLKET